MSKKRVHEIAKEQGLSSKELLEKLRAAGVEAKTASSSVDEAAVLQALGNQRRVRRYSRLHLYRGLHPRRLQQGRRALPRAPAAASPKPPSSAKLPPSHHRPPPLSLPPPPRFAATATATPPPPVQSPAANGAGALASTPEDSPMRLRPRRLPPRASPRPIRRRSGASHARLAHGRARAGRQCAGRSPARGDRLPGLAPPAGRARQPAPAPSPPGPAPARAPTTRRSRRSTRPRWRRPT